MEEWYFQLFLCGILGFIDIIIQQDCNWCGFQYIPWFGELLSDLLCVSTKELDTVLFAQGVIRIYVHQLQNFIVALIFVY